MTKLINIIEYLFSGTSCPIGTCRGTPLVSSPTNRLDMECVSCSIIYKFNPSGELQPISENEAAPVAITKQVIPSIPGPTSKNTVTDSYSYQSDLPPVQLKRVDATDPSAKLSQKLLAGWAMLARPCGEPGCDGAVPLMRDLQGRVICVCCDKVYPTTVEKESHMTQQPDTVDEEVDDDDDDVGDDEGDAEFQRILQQVRVTRLREIQSNQQRFTTGKVVSRDDDSHIYNVSRPITTTTAVTSDSQNSTRDRLHLVNKNVDKATNPIATVILQVSDVIYMCMCMYVCIQLLLHLFE